MAHQKKVCRPDGRELPYTVVAPQAFTVSTSLSMNIVSSLVKPVAPLSECLWFVMATPHLMVLVA